MTEKLKNSVIAFTKDINRCMLLPISFMLLFVPVVFQSNTSRIDEYCVEIYNSYSITTSSAVIRFITLAVFCALAVLLSILFVRRVFAGMTKRHKLFYALCLVFLLAMLLSALLSKQPSIALLGFYNRMEGFAAYLCYIICFVFCSAAYMHTSDERMVSYPLSIVCCINFLLCFTKTVMPESSVTSFISKAFTGKATLSYYEKDGIFGTMPHYNFLGTLCALLVPFFIVLALHETHIRRKLFYTFTACAAVFCLICCSSRAALVSVIVTVIIGIILYIRTVFSHKKSLIAFVCVLTIAVGGVAVFGNKLVSRLPALADDINQIFTDTSDRSYLTEMYVQGAETVGENVVIRFAGGNTITVGYDGGLVLYNKDGGKTAVNVNHPENAKYTEIIPTEEWCNQISFRTNSLTDYGAVSLHYNGSTLLQLYTSENGTYISSRHKNVKVSIYSDEVFEPLVGKERLGSARGYIWSRTIPVLSECVFLGKGADTFVYNFNQYEYLLKYYCYGTSDIVVDKPHNDYLHIMLNGGGTALIAYLAIAVIYLAFAFRKHAFKRSLASHSGFGAACMMSVISYLIVSVFNDSLVSATPIWFVLLGCGVAVDARKRDTEVNK